MMFASKSTVNSILLTKKLLHRHNLGNYFSALHPNISLYILLTVLYTFPKVLIRRISVIIKASLVGDHFLYYRDLNV